MEKYKFAPNDSKIIVNAIVEGYQDYIEHRKDRHNKMKISSAFAWTKGNFIESKIADISETIQFTFRTSKAGLTWDYLQFIHEDKKILFLIQNAASFNEHNYSYATIPNSSKGKGSRRTYLHELSKINYGLEFDDSILTRQELEEPFKQSKQLSLFMPEHIVMNDIDYFSKTYNEFHILTYRIDRAFQISEIIHYLPNPTNNKAYKIEDLSHYITGAELTNEEREILAPEQDSGIIDPAAFDIGILEEEEEK